ncbi:3-hydroxyacyl-CoA dehydrogenase family protein [Ureibacillus endophyticus]|uniref:3-hydroxyacyl-CoA dehydrogenase family protein n=1 Tax=Ureibacillus endophyticus TaxID=1978490 RepID=UPI00319D9A99
MGVLLKKEINGFLVNRILDVIMNEALFLADIGIATPEEIDLAVVHGLGHPMGPYKLMDLVGIDLSYIGAMEYYQETRDPKDKPSPLIVEKYIKGEYGMKTKKGFYTYE